VLKALQSALRHLFAPGHLPGPSGESIFVHRGLTFEVIDALVEISVLGGEFVDGPARVGVPRRRFDMVAQVHAAV
jgi:hypothetical protein